MERDLRRPCVEGLGGFFPVWQKPIAGSYVRGHVAQSDLDLFNIFLFLEVRVVRDMDHRRVGYGCGIRTLLFSSFGNLFLARDTFLHYNDSHFSQLALPAFSSSSFLFFVKILFQLSKFSISTFNKCGYSF